jgi:rhamnogalacturonyl hydrolase YesR
MVWRQGAVLVAATALLAAGMPLRGQNAPPEAQARGVLSAMEKAADWQLLNPSSHPETDWTQAAGDAGMMALAGISENARFRDAMLAVGERNQWLVGPRTEHADDHCIGQTYAELYLVFREPRMIAGLRSRFEGIIGKPSTVESLDFGQSHGAALERWSWCDALFMAPPAWVRLYAATGDKRFLDYAVANWWKTSDYLYDKDEHLFFRDSTYFGRREPNGQKIFWSRGNGWVLAGLVRVLQFLPMNHPDRPRFEKQFTEMAERILSCQNPDGLWRASLLDPADYPMRETSGSGFYTYALAWGVNQGLLERSRFEPAVWKAWAALVSCVNPDGKLTRVQPIGADPKKFSEGSTEVYGVGAFLLAGSEVYRLSLLEKGAVRAVVTITNPSPYFRAQETVEVEMGTPGAAGFVVMDRVSSHILDSQTYAEEALGTPSRLLFQVDLAPGEQRNYDVIDRGDRLPVVPHPVVKTFVRQVPERFNDVAWESDRIAHRVYSQDLIKGEGTVSSGIDVWSKRTRALVVDNFYRRKNYHEDAGEGLDDYEVGRSRGCGGLGVWKNGTLYNSINFRSVRIITTGPVRSEFELTYDAWDVAGRRVWETRRISIDAGSNMSRVESRLSSDNPAPIEVAIGIAQRADPAGQLERDGLKGWMTYWQAADRDRGCIGCAVILSPGCVPKFAEETASVPQPPEARRLHPGTEGLPPVGNALAVTEVRVGDPLVYYLGAGWSRSGDFPDSLAWRNYVSAFAERLRTPILVKVSAPNARG